MSTPEKTAEEPKFIMSNSELAEAITVAHERSGTASDNQKINLEHMKALQAVQLYRAKTCLFEIEAYPNNTIIEQQ